MLDSNYKNALLCLRYGIGDLVLELPVIETLRHYLRDAKITAIGSLPAMELLHDTNLVDECVCVENWGIDHKYSPGKPDTPAMISSWLGKNDFDVVFDACHAAEVVNRQIHQKEMNVYECADIQDTALMEGSDAVSAIKTGAASGWGLNIPEDLYPRIRLTEFEKNFSDQFVYRQYNKKKYCGFSIGASSPLKAWPLENYAEVINALSKKNINFILFADAGNYEALKELYNKIHDNQKIKFAIGLHLKRVAAILTKCDLYFGNDSGLMHMAAAVNTPVVVCFGPTDPDVYAPRWVRNSVISSSLDCRFMKKRAFGHPDCVIAGQCLTKQNCITDISVENVISAIEQFTPSNSECLVEK